MLVTIAPSNFSDWSQLMDLLQTAFAYMNGRIDPPSSLEKMGLEDFKVKVSQETLILATEGEAILGCAFAAIQNDSVYLGKVAVTEAARGRGIARAMFVAAEEIARQHRLDYLELQTRIELIENHLAFTALGFEKIRETAHPGYDKPTSITMRKRISS